MPQAKPLGTQAPIQTLREFQHGSALHARIRLLARDAFIRALSVIPRSAAPNWIRFPYYHYVFDDERAAFAAQLGYLRKLGDFISLDEAVECLASGHPIHGRYFCLTFDDGFRNCLTNALPILLDNRATAAFFLPTRFIDKSPMGDPDLISRVSNGGNRVPEFLSWEECRVMAGAGMTIGSHTVHHLRLRTSTDAEVESELRDSKSTIEREIGRPCDHFSCPKGRAGIDFESELHPQIAKRVGYLSFLTTRRGSVHRFPDPFLVERDHLLAAWGTHQLRYFFSR